MVGTGDGAQTEPVTDILGNVVEGSQNQPYSWHFSAGGSRENKSEPVTLIPPATAAVIFYPIRCILG